MPFINSEYNKLKMILLCAPEYVSIDSPINVIAEKFSKEGIDVDRACKEHYMLVEALKFYGINVLLAETDPRFPYEVNTRDLGVTTPKGIIFGRYLKPIRWGEHRLAEKTLRDNNIPVFAKLDRGMFEGGDFVYLDKSTAAVGIGIRTSMLGVEALKYLLYDTGIELIPVDFAEKFLHLDKIFNVVGEKVAVVCSEALPESFLSLLAEKKFNLIEITEKEVFENAGNIINIGDDIIISHNQAAGVNERLKALGFKIEVLEISELFKSGGGIRCMSFPL